MVGSALVRAIKRSSPEFELILAERKKLDLLDQNAVCQFIRKEKPEIIINAAAKVGGIYANNTFPAEFIHQNLLINVNLIHSAWENGVERFESW